MTSDPLTCRAVDALALSLVSTTLAALAVAVVVLPQRLAQRPGSDGVIALHLDAAGTLRLWNRPVQVQELLELLARRTADHAGGKGHHKQGPLGESSSVLRLIPDPGVPWGIVQQAAAGLDGAGLPLELQLP